MIALAGACFLPAGPVGAGGSHWVLEAESYEPGERFRAWANIGWEHNAELGTPADGPYVAYVAPVEELGSTVWPNPPDSAVRVAELEVHLEPFDAGGVRFGPHHATVEFVVPDLPAGEYALLHCNDPCTKHLGDLSGGGTFAIVPRAVRADPRLAG